MINVLVLLGTRPNIPKAWTLQRALNKFDINVMNITYIHSGQHYSDNLGATFAKEMKIHIDINLHIGSQSSDAHQIAKLMSAINDSIDDIDVDLVIVIGDVNTTLGAAVVASRRGIPIIHLEAGLRTSTMTPEEINRRIISICSNFHLTPSEQATNNLLSEGINKNNIFCVGNAMAETYLLHQDERLASNILRELSIDCYNYLLFTFHKPELFTKINWIFTLLQTLSSTYRIVFPCHPHTRKIIRKSGLDFFAVDNLTIISPLSYIDFSRLLESSKCVITDSAGLQEEASIAGVPCLTMSNHTARPITVSMGTNILAGFDINLYSQLINRYKRKKTSIPLWDTDVSSRIFKALQHIISNLENSDPTNNWILRY